MRGLKIRDRGEYNRILIAKDTVFKKCKIKVNGDNNTISIGGGKFDNCKFCISGDNQFLIIGYNNELNNLRINLVNADSVFIGDDCLMNGGLIQCEGKHNKPSVFIGEECMFAEGVLLQTFDFHPIYKDGKRINDAKDIIINDKVWLAKEVMCLKGANIPTGCIIGARSIVTKALKSENCLYAGIPAKIKKREIRWEREY